MRSHGDRGKFRCLLHGVMRYGRDIMRVGGTLRCRPGRPCFPEWAGYVSSFPESGPMQPPRPSQAPRIRRPFNEELAESEDDEDSWGGWRSIGVHPRKMPRSEVACMFDYNS